MFVGSSSPGRLAAEGVVMNECYEECRSDFIPHLDSCSTGLLPLRNKLSDASTLTGGALLSFSSLTHLLPFILCVHAGSCSSFSI